MSASIIPGATLTDETFPFNKDAFIQIRNYQQKDLAFLQSPPVKVLVGVGDGVGGASTAVVGAAGQAASGVASSLFGGVGQVTSGLGLPGGGLLGNLGKSTVGAINTADVVGQQLVDPTKVAREHYHYSNDVNNALPPAIDAVDKLIHDFASNAGHVVQQLYENLATQGVKIITDLLNVLAEVDKALTTLYGVLTKNNIQESLIVGQDKYKAVPQVKEKNYLQELSQYLPEILKTIQEVKAAFADIAANFNAALGQINNGVYKPEIIFAQSHEEVVTAWQSFEVKRKTMTYLPYKY